MRFGIPTFVWTWPFTNEGLPLVQKVADLGFDDLEVIFDGDSDGLDPVALRDRLDEASLGASVGAYGLPHRDVSAADRTVRDAGVQYLTDAVDFAVAIGARVVAGPVAHPPGRARLLSAAERRAERENAVASLRTVGEYAAEHGIRFGVEAVSRYDGDMFNTTAEALAFLSEVGHESIGLLLDAFPMQMEERSLGDAIRAAGDTLVHFHAAESHRGAPGTGTVNWDEVFSALRDIGYDQGVAVESCGMTGTELDGLMKMWRPWFDDRDAFAAESLKFLRSKMEASADVK
jgi:D-psicose/D-tagatose/L-ribulose 3-epimerase